MLSVDVHDAGKNMVNGDVTGDGHIHLTNLGAKKVAGGTADFDSEEEETYNPGEGDPEPDPEPETVHVPTDGIEVETRDHQQQGPQVKISNNREGTINAVYEWGDGTQEVFTVNGNANSGWRDKGDGETYEG
ncbi:hypothetical protein [Natrinema sp. H-ect4]|uniref:hypothetical protein n=1 Tax=Natrinema sp. H-ect4 TaxID=3242699 RepID=UPI0035A991D5